MTLVLIGLDALDVAQVDHYGIDTFRLRDWGEMESVSHQLDWPHTGEVWPTVATGLHPTEHGITMSGESEWDNLILELGSKFTGHLPNNVRGRLGRAAKRTTGADWHIAYTDAETMFDAPGRMVHNWPGVHRNDVLEYVWKEIDHANDRSIPEQQFDAELTGIAASQFGYVLEMLDRGVPLAATHVHMLDAAGHAYRFNEEHYRTFYERAAAFVERVLDALGAEDELLLLSDHGLRTDWLDDEDVGVHSWRAYSGTTADTRPESVFDVREWVEERVEDVDWTVREDVDFDEEHLEDLGYIQ